MDAVCPFCGSPVAASDVQMSAVTGIIGRAGKTAKLQPMEYALFAGLMRHARSHPQGSQPFMARAVLIEELWPDPDTAPVIDMLRRHVALLRGKVEPLGFTIQVSYKHGYRLLDTMGPEPEHEWVGRLGKTTT